LLDPQRQRAGFSGLTRGIANPQNGQQSIPVSFAQGHAHEFTHGFSNVRDEYFENDNMPRSTAETSNVVGGNRCADLPWAHLLAGKGINTTAGLVGAFGRPMRGYHPELKCLMNGTHDNGQYFCAADATGAFPSLTLRVNDRMCNFCREMTSYHVFDRTGLLPAGNVGFARWKTEYRPAFYQRFGFRVPAPVPQVLQCRNQMSQPVFEDCVP
jgi:hypothetical protein